MILTEEIFEKGKSINGGWSDAQVQCFGVTTRKNKGWKRQIIGKDFAPESINKFLRLQNKHLKRSEINKSYNLAESLWAVVLYTWFGSKTN